jgi:Fe-Mn family superoxide dismutase
VITTSGHDNPLMQALPPLLLNDAWEHAYYLKHENRRAGCLNDRWKVVNWPEAERRYELSDQSPVLRRKADGGQQLEAAEQGDLHRSALAP